MWKVIKQLPFGKVIFAIAFLLIQVVCALYLPYITTKIVNNGIAAGNMWIGSNSVANGTMEVGTIMGVISYSAQILMGFGVLTSVILAIPCGQVSAKRIYEVLDMPLSIENPQNAKDLSKSKVTLAF